MWTFSSSLKSGNNLWPPDVGQQQRNPDSLLFPTCTNTNGIFFSNSSAPFSGLGVQGIPIDLNADFISPLNSQVFKPANASSGRNSSTLTKRFLVFDHSGYDQRLVFSSVAEAFQTLTPTQPSRNASCNLVSNSHRSDKQEEIHEDTKEIDALLYSDSEFSLDSEEASTGHSPLNVREEEVTSSPIPPKRRKLDLNHSAVDESLVDTASSARAFNFSRTTSDENAAISYVDSGSNVAEESSDESGKRRRIQTIIRVLRRIIPGGYAMNTAALLDEAICYLNLLKLQANSIDPTTPSI